MCCVCHRGHYEGLSRCRLVGACVLPNKNFFFVLRKKGSETKERMKEEEIEKGDCGPPTRKVLFLRFCRT